MDIEALQERYNSNIPSDVQEFVDRFEALSKKPGVKSIRLLSNFGKDVEMSLKHDVDIFRGFIIQLNSTYKLSQDDRMWLHPELCKGRSLYKGGNAVNTKVELSSFNSSVGYYSNHTVDEIGGFTVENNVVVDTGIEKDAEVLLNSWLLSGSSMEDAYRETVKSKLVQKAQHARNKIAEEYGSKELELNSNYNMLYSNGHSYYFYNHAIKPSQNGEAILNISPLMGCVKLTGIEDLAVESDLVSSNQYIDVSKLNDTQRKRALVSCRWDGKNIANTFTFRKPIENYKNYLDKRKNTVYRMQKGFFSANAIHEKLPTDIVLFLTPKSQDIPEETNCHAHLREDVLNIPGNAGNLQKVMPKFWKKLVDPKFIMGENILLPRSMVEEIV